MEGKNTSRFSTLRVFKLAGGSKPPPPPPKDAPGPYSITPYMTSAASTSQLTLNTIPGSSQDLSLAPSASHTRSPTGDDSRFLHPHSPISPHSARSVSPVYTPPSGNAFKKGLSKLSSLGRGPKRSQTAGSIPHSPSMSALPEHDDGISGPWNFQHNVHVNGDLHGLPPSWSSSLAEAGFSEAEIATLRTRHRIPPPSDNPPQFSTAFAHPSASAPAAQSSTPMIVNPKPRNDSLRRTAANLPARATTVPASSATAALNFVRRPPSPASSTNSSHPATSMHTNAPSQQSPATSPIDSPTQSLSQSSSGRSPAPVPLSLRTFHVVNDDPDPAGLTYPPPAYVAPASTLMGHASQSPQRRRSIEKLPLPEPDSGSRLQDPGPEPEPEPEQGSGPTSVLGPELGPESEEAPPPEEDSQEQDVEDTRQEDPEAEAEADLEPESESLAPLTPQIRMPALPPRLSLHTDQYDDWADMFSFLPSRDSAAGPSKRSSVVSPSKRTSITVKRDSVLGRRDSVQGKRESLQAKRRSKRFVTTPPSLTLSDPSSSTLTSDTRPESSTVYAPPREDFGVFTPEGAYPMANSPLWEEVRTLVRAGAPIEVPEQESRPDPHTSLAPPSPALYSRFSDVSSIGPDLGPSSRFSDASSFQGNSRFSEATTFSDAGSRFSAWSTAAQHPPSTLFAPLEAMPESPVVEPSLPHVNGAPLPQQHFVYPPPRRSNDLPPPLPPPKDDPPPPPLPRDEEQDITADTSRGSHMSGTSSVLIHGARTATRNALPLSRSTSVSFSSRSTPAHTPSPPTTSPQDGRPPPLPLPPAGKVLPSFIKEERRRQRSEDSGSASSSTTHSRSTSNDSGVMLSVSASALSSYEEPPKSPMLAYLEDSMPKALPNGAVHEDSDEDDEDTVPLAQLRKELRMDDDTVRMPRKDLRAEDDAAGIPVEEGQVSESIELEASISESPSVYDHGTLPPPVTPSITVNGVAPSPQSPSFLPSPVSEYDSEPEDEPRELPLVLSPLSEYIYADFDPLTMFLNLQEVAQGQYGSVYAAEVADSPDSVVAVKKVPIPANGTLKIAQLRHELELMSQARHKHILAADGLFFDWGESTLWIRMELMERSLADVLELHDDGLVLQEKVIARFASDALLALAYLYDLGLAHRDLRSDNILINSEGVLKLADFSNAVHVTRQDPFCFGIVGVHHWQAPEIRKGRYDASLVDVWSLGATCWEMAESIPPFADIEDTRALSDRWPPLSRAIDYSPVFHDFLRLCSEPPASRPPASQLLHHLFIQQACPRDDILQILHLCRQIEEGFQRQEES